MKNLCLKCGHKWKQRGKDKPKVCPICKSKLWENLKEKDFIKLLIR